MSLGVQIALVLAFAFVVFLFKVLNREDNDTDFTKMVTPQLKDEDLSHQEEIKNRYVSVEHEEFCDRVYFDSAEICQDILRNNTTELIQVSSKHVMPEKSHINKEDLITALVFNWRHHIINPSSGRSTQSFGRDKSIQVYAPTEGYLHHHSMYLGYAGKRFLVASIYHNYNNLLEQEYPFKYKIETDAFDNTKKIVWGELNGTSRHDLWLSEPYVNVSYSFQGNIPILLIWYKYKTSKGTQLELLFEDKSILRFPLCGNLMADGSVITPITPHDIECFSTQNLQTIRVRKNEDIHDYQIDPNEQESLRRFSSTFRTAIEEIAEEKEIQEWKEQVDKQPVIEFTVENKKDNSCWVYLMHDLANNAYKIGISNNPEYRERTLQSEKPTIVKVAARQFPTRDIARAFEASLHKVYEVKRLRGEWFRLDPNEVEDVRKALE